MSGRCVACSLWHCLSPRVGKPRATNALGRATIDTPPGGIVRVVNTEPPNGLTRTDGSWCSSVRFSRGWIVDNLGQPGGIVADAGQRVCPRSQAGRHQGVQRQGSHTQTIVRDGSGELGVRQYGILMICATRRSTMARARAESSVASMARSSQRGQRRAVTSAAHRVTRR